VAGIVDDRRDDGMSQRMPARVGSGWLLFSAVVLITAGIMRIFDAFWAFDRDDEAGDLQTWLFKDNLSAYGWFWLILGILLILAGFAILNGSEWARWFGIFMAALAAVSAMTWIYAFPVWSMVSTLIGFLVVYGLTMYGGREV
jgi:hypothetical protein